MTHNSTRKQFFAKLLGVITATSVFPKLFAKSASAGPVTSSSTTSTFEIRHDTRAVARRDVA